MKELRDLQDLTIHDPADRPTTLTSPRWLGGTSMGDVPSDVLASLHILKKKRRGVRKPVLFGSSCHTVGDSRLTRGGTTHSRDLSGRGTAREEDAQATPTQSHISPSILEYRDKHGTSVGDVPPDVLASLQILDKPRVVVGDPETVVLVPRQLRAREPAHQQTSQSKPWLSGSSPLKT